MDPAALEDLVARRAEFPNVTIAGIHYFSGTQKRKDAVIAKELAHLDEYLTMLRERYGFTGEVRAVGDVLREQAGFMVRVGFDAFEPADGSTPEQWAHAAHRQRHVYQRAADRRAPAFAERE